MAPFISLACGIASTLTVLLAVETGKGTKRTIERRKEEMPEKIDLETKKEIAKIGMTLSLGVTVLTAPCLKGTSP